MGKTSSLTGTGKKNLKKVQKDIGATAEQHRKELKSEAKRRKSALHRDEQIAKGRHIPEYKGRTKYEPSKFKPETKYEPSKFKSETKYDHRTLGQLQKDFERAGRGLEPMFEKRKQAALADYAQNLAPEVTGQYGQGTAGSSALFQAQNAAKANLSRNLSADFESMRNNIAGNLLGERERQRQFSSQFGAGQENFYNQLRNQQEQYKSQFGGAQEQFYNQLRNQQEQYAGQFGIQQEQNRYNSQLQGLNARLNANQSALGHPTTPQFSNIQGNYNQKQQPQSNELLGGIGQGAATAATAWALSSIAASSKDIKENIKDYEKGLDIIRDLEVKNYDYSIPVVGRKTNRVGLIAEDVPEEIQDMIGEINAVDVYGLVGILVNAVKQLDVKVKSLEEQHA